MAVGQVVDAKKVCESRLLGLALPGVDARQVENVIGVGLGRKVTRGQGLQETVLRVFVLFGPSCFRGFPVIRPAS